MLNRESRDTLVQKIDHLWPKIFWVILKNKKYLKQKHFISEINRPTVAPFKKWPITISLRSLGFAICKEKLMRKIVYFKNLTLCNLYQLNSKQIINVRK